ncbi:ABC transporter family substrate-binding protein [Cryobacterium sp. CG_9.6]|uniref:ABC transporter family substrate-binding protein n=1 Tax=Cryobacterium sp. CG_9.6 TaxID=2760710 RepID=UPI0024742A72|nr:ABC transporter family substrate-binding protein [Cryobacterium sp. CG_9.6]MDH6236138.1 peptide/nickel transport system substrate-binding protein [Cryobacterium sp. CG_9.6]
MRIRRIGALVATVGATALVLSGCSAPAAESGLDEGTSVNVAWNQAFYSYNGATSFGNATANNNIIYMTNDWFNYYDNTPELQKNESFGSYELVSEDPLTVKYTIADGVTWSDGTDVDAADLLLDWAANSRSLDTPDFDPADFTDPDTGEFTDAFPTDVVYFDSGAQPDSGLGLVQDVPTISDDGMSMTMVYSSPYVDWELALPSALPAHVVGKNALELTDNAEAKDAVLAAIEDGDAAALAPISTFWNSGFNFTELPSDPELFLGTGPYTISAFVADQYITLTANPDYEGQNTPSIEEITVRFITDPLAAVQALQNGDVDVISPQATSDLVTALDGVENVTVIKGVEGTYEHIDLQVDQSKSGVFNDPLVREAFMKVIPRQEILDKLIKPIVGEDAALRGSQILVPGSAGYDESVAANGSEAYADVDVAGATELLAQAGVASPEVCILYASNNPRRVNEFQLIQTSAALAGFNVTDCGSTEWGGLLGTPASYDASLFGWQSTSLGVTSSGPTFETGGINNLNFFSNAEVDSVIKELNGEFDLDKQITLQQELDKLLWDNYYGVTLFQFPGVTAFSDKVEGIEPSILAPTIFWNVWDWKLAAA